MTTWTWVDGGVEIAGQMHGFGQIALPDARAMVRDCNRNAEILETLRAARTAFWEGQALYSGASKNLGFLIDEIRQAEINWNAGADAVLKSFVPPIPQEKIPAEVKTRFIYEALLKVGAGTNGAAK